VIEHHPSGGSVKTQMEHAKTDTSSGNLSSPSKPQSNPSHITLRAVVLGCLLLPVNAYWIAMVEMVWHGFHFSATSIPMNVIFIIFTLTLFNAPLQRFFPHHALSQAELLVIYIILATTTSVIAHDNMVSLMGLFTHPFWFATPENEWKQILQPHLPKWLVMEHVTLARPFYEGGANFFTEGYLRYWIVPILSWTAIASLIFFLVAFLNVFVRRQWIEHERLPYPIAQLPLDMTSTQTKLLNNRVMWLGFWIAAIIEIINGLNFLYPTVPLIPIREPTSDLSLWLTSAPWNAIGTTYFHLRLFMVGLCFLLPLDLSFSTAFFYWMRKVQFVGGKAAGFYTIPYYPFQPHQATGAVIAIVIMVTWAGRKHFREIAKRLVGVSSTVDDSNEPMGYRTAAVGIVVCLALLYLICSQAGMSAWVFVSFFGLYMVISVAVTRIRAELGPPVHNMGGVNPQTILTTVLGMRPFGTRNLVVFSLFSWFNGSNRSHPMPHQLEGFKLAQRTGLDARRLIWVVAFAIVPAAFVAFLIYLHALYQYGASIAVDAPGQVLGPGQSTYNQLAGWLQFPQPPDIYGSVAMVLGFVFTMFLGIMRLKFIWWPFHPVGYVMGINGGTLDHFWFALILSSSIKLVVLKYGGASLYRRTLPFFLGLILGDVVSGCYWSILSVIIKMPLYVVWFW
jgi:hypothetical protein